MAVMRRTNTQAVMTTQFQAGPRARPSVASVTVVYNAGLVLRKHLDSLKQQDHKLDEIIVVDNASTDDTCAIAAHEYPEVTLIRLPANVGVGGGFAAGLDYAAFHQKYDWIWMFDQDSAPASDGLQRLLTAVHSRKRAADRLAIVAPVCVDAETGTPCYGLSWKGARLRPTPPDAREPLMLLDSVVTSGSLIRREALEEVGLPRADFFMDFVDHEHCLRLRRHGFEVALVPDCQMMHSLGKPARVQLLGWSSHWSDHDPWREYYMTRNEVFTIWRYYSRAANKAMTVSRLLRHGLGILLFGTRKRECWEMMYRGFHDGRAGRLGITMTGSKNKNTNLQGLVEG